MNSKDLMIYVERIVRPVRARQSRKLRMRRELLAHLEAALEEERCNRSDDAAAARLLPCLPHRGNEGHASHVSLQHRRDIDASVGALIIFQYRAVLGSMVRWASLSVASSVSLAIQAFPRGFSGPHGSGSQFTSTRMPLR